MVGRIDRARCQKMVFPERVIDTLEGVGYIPPSFVKGIRL
jgi:hypothetical protein